MYFRHSSEIWRDYPGLVPGVLYVEGIDAAGAVGSEVAKFSEIAKSRLAASSEGEFPEVQAWRRVFSKMGLKPTQYRCASEALLRRFKKEGDLPRLHPLIDLCNAVSLAFGIPVAVFDTSKIADFIEVRYASGSEVYLTFSSETEHPDVREVVFADSSGRAHARRWTNRQSGYSAVHDGSSNVLIVAEAVHSSAYSDIQKLTETLSTDLCTVWKSTPKARILNRFSPQFDF